MNVARYLQFVRITLGPLAAGSALTGGMLAAQQAPAAQPVVAKIVAEPARITIRAGETQKVTITAYDAAYVALAERLDAVLITCDARLVAATGPNCTFDPLT